MQDERGVGLEPEGACREAIGAISRGRVSRFQPHPSRFPAYAGRLIRPAYFARTLATFGATTARQ